MKDTAFHVKFVRGIALLLVFYDLKNTHRTRTELAFDRRFDVAEVGKNNLRAKGSPFRAYVVALLHNFGHWDSRNYFYFFLATARSKIVERKYDFEFIACQAC